jgi:hypothetical protein
LNRLERGRKTAVKRPAANRLRDGRKPSAKRRGGDRKTPATRLESGRKKPAPASLPGLREKGGLAKGDGQA